MQKNLQEEVAPVDAQKSGVIGSTDEEFLTNFEQSLLQLTKRDVTDREKQLANVTNQTLSDRLQLQRGLDKPFDRDHS